jgi:hypothetical protein
LHRKIYLPLKKHSDGQKVQIIACASAAIAADYIEKFVADNGELLQQRKQQLEAGKPADAFLLILTPWKGVDFYGAQSERKDKKYCRRVSNGSADIFGGLLPVVKSLLTCERPPQ